MSHNLIPDDWYIEPTGESRILDQQKVAVELGRLRAALQQIVDEADSDDGLTAWDGGDIARKTLAA